MKENCYFVAGIVQEALMDMFWGVLDGREPTWPREHAPDARNQILRRVYGESPAQVSLLCTPFVRLCVLLTWTSTRRTHNKSFVP